MWTDQNRSGYNRDSLRYPSDLTDKEWEILAPLIPPAKHGGRPREVDMREVINGLLYLLSTGCQWRQIPKDLPARSTIYEYLQRFDWDGTLLRINHELYVRCREHAEREPNPTAAIIDSQTAKGGEKGGPASTRRATMRARKSKAASAISWSIRRAC
jgi:transposase